MIIRFIEIPEQASSFLVQITEPPESIGPLEPTDDGPLIRDVTWMGQAESEEEAGLAAFELWNEKYGTGDRPAEPFVLVSRIDR